MPDPNCLRAGCIHRPGFVISCGYDVEIGRASVGDGWRALVSEAFDRLPAGVKIVQVKQKFGVLTIYTEPHDKSFATDVLQPLAAASTHTCEGCAAPAEPPGSGSFTVACPACRQHIDEYGSWPPRRADRGGITPR